MDELPVGLAFSLSMNRNALNYYASLDTNVQNQISNYIQDSQTGEEAKSRISQTVESLANSDINFLYFI